MIRWQSSEGLCPGAPAGEPPRGEPADTKSKHHALMR